MSKTDTIKNIYQRMIEVQKAVKSVDKNETVKMHDNDKGYKAVTHDDVAAALHLPLAEAGVFMLPDVVDFSTTQFDKPNYNGKLVTWYRTDIKILVKWINADNPSDFIASTGAAFALDTSDKSFAKAYSLALKIVLLKVHLLESRDGEEQRLFEEQGGHLNKPQPKPQQKQQAPQVKPQAQATAKPQAQAKPKDVKFEKDLTPASSDLVNELLMHAGKFNFTDDDLVSMSKRGWGVENATPTYMVKEMLEIMNKPESNREMILRFVQSLEDIRALKSRPVEDKKGNDPAQFVMPIGADDVKGKKLIDLDEAKLKSILSWSEKELLKSPPAANVGAILEIKINVQKFLKSVGV